MVRQWQQAILSRHYKYTSINAEALEVTGKGIDYKGMSDPQSGKLQDAIAEAWLTMVLCWLMLLRMKLLSNGGSLKTTRR